MTVNARVALPHQADGGAPALRRRLVVGLDPRIGPAAALAPVGRVGRARKVDESTVRRTMGGIP